MTTRTFRSPRQEIESLRRRLAEAEQTLEAIRSGAADSIVVETTGGPRVFALEGAGHPYRVLIEAMSEGAASLTTEGVILFGNRRLAALLHVPLEQLIGSAILDHVPEAQADALEALLREAPKRDTRGELTLRSRAGQEIPVLVSISALEDEGRTVLCLLATDLREQKRTQEIVASERLTRSVVDQAAEGIVVCDQDGRIVRANSAAATICGTNPYRRHFDEAFAIRLADAAACGDAERTAPVAETVLAGRVLRAATATLRRPDGVGLELLVSATQLHGAQAVGCVISLLDVTELRRAEAIERRYAEVLHLSDDAILVWRLDGGIETWNRGAEDLFGYTADEALGRLPRELLRSEFPVPYEEVVSVLRMWGRWEGEIEHLRRDGGTVVASAKLKLVLGDDGAERVLESSRDTTERRRLEQELRAGEERARAQLAEIESIYRSAPVGLAVIDTEGRYVRVNQRMAEINGRPAEDHVGRTFRELIPELADEAEALHERVVTSGEAVLDTEVAGRTAASDRTRYWLEKWLPLKDQEGRVTAVNVVIEEITERKEAEEQVRRALAQAEEGDRLLAALMASVPEGITIADGPDARIRMVSRHGQELLGGSHAGMTVGDVAATWRVYGKDGTTPIPDHELPLARALRHGETVTNVELVQVASDGRRVSLLCNAAPVRDGDGAVVGAIVAWRDIGALREAEQAVVLSEQKFAAAFSDNPAAITLTRLEDGVFIDVNATFLETSGYRRDEVIGRSVRTMSRWRDPAAAQRFIDELRDKGHVRGWEQEFLAKSGDVIVTELSARVLTVGDEQVILSTLVDITERKRAELERERVVAELNAVLASMSDGLNVWHADGTLAYMNPAGARIFGIEAEAWPDTVPQLRDILRTESETGELVAVGELPSSRALQGETVPPMTVRIHRPDGTDAWLSASAAPIRTEQGEQIGAVVVYRDISDQVDVEEQQKDLIRMVSHDLRSPLGALLLQAQLIQRVTDPSDPNVRRAEMIIANGQKMAAMIRDLADMIRLEGGQLQMQCEWLDFEEFAGALRDRLAGLVDVERIVIECAPGLPPVWADPERIERVLVNLLHNALRHSAPSEPVVVAAAPAPSGGLRISVVDHGSGIPAEDVPRLFERFYRSRSGRRGEGLGLGLYIAQILVRAHGGAITVDTEPGRGSAFHVTLPVGPSSS